MDVLPPFGWCCSHWLISVFFRCFPTVFSPSVFQFDVKLKASLFIPHVPFPYQCPSFHPHPIVAVGRCRKWLLFCTLHPPPTYPLRETIEGPKPATRAQWPPGISRCKLSLGQAALRADKWGLTVFLSSGSVKSLQTSQKNWGSGRLGADLLVMQGHRQTKAIEGNKTWWNRKVKDGSGANCRQRPEEGGGGGIGLCDRL